VLVVCCLLLAFVLAREKRNPLPSLSKDAWGGKSNSASDLDSSSVNPLFSNSVSKFGGKNPLRDSDTSPNASGNNKLGVSFKTEKSQSALRSSKLTGPRASLRKEVWGAEEMGVRETGVDDFFEAESPQERRNRSSGPSVRFDLSEGGSDSKTPEVILQSATSKRSIFDRIPSLAKSALPHISHGLPHEQAIPPPSLYTTPSSFSFARSSTGNRPAFLPEGEERASFQQQSSKSLARRAQPEIKGFRNNPLRPWSISAASEGGLNFDGQDDPRFHFPPPSNPPLLPMKKPDHGKVVVRGINDEWSTWTNPLHERSKGVGGRRFTSDPWL